MTLDLEIRRSIRKISRADFAGYPVWEWAIDEEETLGQRESFVRPTSLERIAPDLARQYIVSARVTLSDGSVLPGCVELKVRAGKVQALPMFIFLQDRQLDFGGPATLATLSHYTKSADVHPVAWELAVPLAGRASPLTGKLRRGLWARLTRLLGRSALPTALSRV